MEQAYIQSRFCKSLKQLMQMGLWPPDFLTKKSHKRIFYVYACLWYFALLTALILQATDFYLVLGNFKKMVFNFCSSTLITLFCLKMILLFTKKEEMRNIHSQLWEDSKKYTDAEDIASMDDAYYQLNYVRKSLYGSGLILITLMGFSSYFSYNWGQRILPFAGYLPMEDLNNDVSYLPALLYECAMALYIGIGIMESDLTMLSLISQIQAHCHILSKNLMKIGVVDGTGKGEVNKYLRNEKIKKELREIVKRHLELLKYCDQVESIFNLVMGLQLAAGFFVMVMNGVETTRQITDVSIQLCYQLIYIADIMFDLYIICFYFTTLTNEFINVGFAAYSADWYETDVGVKKTLCLIIIRAQKPPRFTYGKLFIINVNMYMHLANARPPTGCEMNYCQLLYWNSDIWHLHFANKDTEMLDWT